MKGTAAMDGGGIDVWIGSRADRKLSWIICTVDLMNRDAEIKLLLGCTGKETEQVYRFHNETRNMKGLLILAPED